MAGRNCRVGDEFSRSHVCQAGWRFFFLIPWNRYRSKSALFALPYERLNSQCLAGSLTRTHFLGVSYANDSLFLGGNG